MLIRFTKMHGASNDYVYVNCLRGELPEPEKIAVEISDRHRGVGSDGLIMICSSDIADARMRMFNADGSEGRMCGNGIRCVGKFLYDGGFVKKTVMTIETLSGVKTLHLHLKDGLTDTVSVDMGRAEINAPRVPVLFDGEIMKDAPVEVCGRQWKITAVSMGNPHAVTFVDDPETLDLPAIGPHFENLPIFPEKVNTEFIAVTGKNSLTMRVWERGSGETLACGTGACASVTAACLLGYCDLGASVRVRLRGGELVISCAPDLSVTMTGEAVKVFDGEYEYADQDK